MSENKLWYNNTWWKRLLQIVLFPVYGPIIMVACLIAIPLLLAVGAVWAAIEYIKTGKQDIL